MANVENKRRFVRLSFPYTIYLKTVDGFDISAYTENIGVGGVKVVIRERLEVMDIIDTQIFIQREPFFCKARVEWVKEITSNYLEYAKLYEIGLEFLNISNADKHLINERVMTLGFLDKFEV